MTVLRKEPGRQWEIVEIENTLEALQESVGGYIEAVNIYEDACIICNEEGRLMGLPYNCMIKGVDFVGPILIVGVSGEDFCGIPMEAAVRIANKFNYKMALGGADKNKGTRSTFILIEELKQ